MPAMDTTISILVGATAVAVALVLATGLLGFAKNGPWYKRNSLRLMNLRVAAQFTAIVLVLILALMHG